MHIHCFSGTGNSLQVARWIAQEIPRGATISMIEKRRGAGPDIAGSAHESQQSIGVVFPAHGGTAPLTVIRYVLNLRSVKKSYGPSKAIVVATRGCTKPGPFYLPGAELNATLIIALILFFKGYDIRGTIGIDMPANWTSMMWGLSFKNQQPIFERAERKAKWFIREMLADRRRVFNFLNILMMLVGLVVLPISFLYTIFGHFALAKLFFANKKCNGCGVCSSNCPVGAIRMTGSKSKRPYWTFSCESCMRCMNYCPKGAVESSHLLLAGYMAFLYIPLWPLLFAHLPLVLAVPVAYAAMFASIFIAYGVSWLLNNTSSFRWFFTGLALTRFFRRYHAPDISLKDMKGQ